MAKSGGKNGGPATMPNDIPGAVPGPLPSPASPVPTVNPYPGSSHRRDVPGDYTGPVQPIYRSGGPKKEDVSLTNDEEGDARPKDE